MMLFHYFDYDYNFLQMKVIHVSNATRLWVTLLEHCSHNNETTPLYFHSEIEFKRLSLDLAQYYSAPENRVFQGDAVTSMS